MRNGVGDLAHVVVHDLVQRGNQHGIAGSLQEPDLHLRISHQGRAPCDVVDPLKQLRELRGKGRPDLIQRGRVGLHDVGRVSAGIRNGIMDSGCRRHVLPEKLHPDVHQLQRVKRAPSRLRRRRRMGRLAGEAVADDIIRQNRPGRHHVAGVRMPAEGGVQLIKAALARHKGLSGAALLGRAAEEDHGSRLPLCFQRVLEADSTHERADAEQVVAAAVSVSAVFKGFLHGDARLLAQAGKRVVLSEKADHGLPASPLGAERCFQPCDADGHSKAFSLEKSGIILGRLLLSKADLRVIPDLVAERVEIRRSFLQVPDSCLLVHMHISFREFTVRCCLRLSLLLCCAVFL